MQNITVGLFGTCGDSKWRDKFEEEYKKRGVEYYTPLVKDWTPENAKKEAQHLVEDAIIVCPVTSETYGLGSLSEIGFGILHTLSLNKERYFVVMVADTLDGNVEDVALRQESYRTRALVRAHLEKINLVNVYICDTLEQVLEVSLELHSVLKQKQRIAKLLD